MLGAAGAALCLAAGTAVGFAMRQNGRARLMLLQAETDMLGGMRLLLAEERLSMGGLLARCAALVPVSARPLGERMAQTAKELERNPLAGVEGAYRAACEAYPIPWEREEEREQLSALFCRLGTGSAAMRERAVAACLRRLAPTLARAREKCEQSGRLCVRLGMLLGLTLGIALW